MALLRKNAVPGLQHHRASGRAVVRLSGQDLYCGTWGSKAAIKEYDRLVAEWLARGRRPLVEQQDDGERSIVELAADYLEHAQGYYRKNGQVTSEYKHVFRAVDLVKRLYGRELANDFGPLRLEAVRSEMIKLGWSRREVNKQVGRIVRMFGWGVLKEIVRGDVAHALRELPGLKAGRTEARETAPVENVPDAVVNATLDHLPPMVADMVRLQRLTGCRPEEVCMLRPCDVDTSGTVWSYRPESHKTQHHGRARVIFIGPRGQDVLRPYLLRDKARYCFCPADGERKRRELAHEARQTPLHHGNRPGTNRKAKPEVKPGERYTSDSYRRSIHRACDLAFGLPEDLKAGPPDETADQKAKRLEAVKEWREKHTWSPNQLRHSAATEIREKYGLEAAQVVLGHSTANVTELYAARDLRRAAEVIAAVG